MMEWLLILSRSNWWSVDIFLQYMNALVWQMNVLFYCILLPALFDSTPGYIEILKSQVWNKKPSSKYLQLFILVFLGHKPFNSLVIEMYTQEWHFDLW